MSANPCMTCGACCANFRVSFYWGETDAAAFGTVPQQLTQKINHQRVCMSGTNQKQPRCVALVGEIGQEVSCTIYQQRPSPCRDFGINQDGVNPDCDKARARYGLVPIHIVDIEPSNAEHEIVA